jgi:hypothetical protein
LIPQNFSGRGGFGSWQMSVANHSNWKELLTNVRDPLYLWRMKFFSKLFRGISYDFLSNLNFIGFIVGALLIYIIIKNLTENKKAAYAGSLLYLFNPIIFTFSLTEDYALLALFLMIVAFFFASLYVKSGDKLFLIPTMSSVILSAGSRIEYIFFPFLFLLFYLFFVEKEKGKYKQYYGSLLLFLILIVPRALATIGMYFEDAQSDTALTVNTYTYEGKLIPYIIDVLLGASSFFIKNLKTAFSILLNPYNLNLLLLLIGVITFIFSFRQNKKIKKTVFFFAIQFIFLIFYYSYFHAVVGIDAPRYQITILFPLIIISSIGIGFLLKRKTFLYYLFLELLLVFSFITVIFPLTFQDNFNLMVDKNIRYFVSNSAVLREYEKYDSLTYENRITNLIGSKIDIRGGENVYYLSNGERNLIHSMPITMNFLALRDKEDLKKIRKQIPSEATIYISQSELGFTSHQIDRYSAINPSTFEEEVKKYFIIEEEFISYQVNDHHVFLYKVKIKEDND